MLPAQFPPSGCLGPAAERTARHTQRRQCLARPSRRWPVSPSEALGEILTPPWRRPPPGSSPRVGPSNPGLLGPSCWSLEGLDVPQFALHLPPPGEKVGCGLSPSAGPGPGPQPAGLSGPDQAWPPVSWPGCPYLLFQGLALWRVPTLGARLAPRTPPPTVVISHLSSPSLGGFW